MPYCFYVFVKILDNIFGFWYGNKFIKIKKVTKIENRV